MNKLTSSYYSTANDTKYAKTTTLTDRNCGSSVGSNAFASTTRLQSNDINNIFDNGDADAMYGTHNGVNSIVGYPQMQHTQILYPIRRAGSRAEIDMLERETSSQMRYLDVSAGDLLSRTHEELVLLLIQLRRQNSNTARAIEQCCTDIHEVQNYLRTAQGLSRAESIQRLDYLKAHLLELERQYEKSKPLVNLVDNMVKLGSLYRNNDVTKRQNMRYEPTTVDRLEFNQRLQERYLLDAEQQQWDTVSPNNQELQSKIEQLYKLDQLLQEESGTLQILQREKDDLELALSELKTRIRTTNEIPLAAEIAKKQQLLLERELVRVHQLLAENSKVEEKLEQTVDGNMRLEQELMILRQKLQLTTSPQESNFLSGVSETYARNTTAMLESELKRVQNLVGDMQRQRQDLTAAVRKLTENSQRLYQEIGNRDHSLNGSIRKRNNSACWIETDLDSMRSINRTMNDSTLSLSTPLYVDASGDSISNHIIHSSNTASCRLDDYNVMAPLQRRASTGERSNYRYNDTTNDHYDTLSNENDCYPETNPFAKLSNSEKQEIKTVRIVKRESERRHRDRSERNGLSNSTQNLDQVLEEDQLQMSTNYTQLNGSGEYSTTIGRSKSLPRGYNETPKSRHHQSRFQNGISSKQNGQKYHDKKINYSQNSNGITSDHVYSYSNGGSRNLNPLANAYFAKQLQQQKQQSQKRQSSQNVLQQKTDSMQSLNKSLTDLSPGPVFQSEAARQIISEMSAGSASEDTEKIIERVPPQHKHRRSVPREKRRHYTAPNDVNIKAMEKVQAENDMNRNNTNWRARDDLDMEVTLRPRMNAPDVVRSALGHGEKISENTIDNLLLAPNKIVIPERYVPEKTPELSPEEKKRRQEKVESIKRMLSEAPISTANDAVPPSKINAEKKQREHLLQLNQILAQQVMQMSKIVAEKAMSRNSQPSSPQRTEFDEERKSESPSESLPIFQQRDNYYS